MRGSRKAQALVALALVVLAVACIEFVHERRVQSATGSAASVTAKRTNDASRDSPPGQRPADASLSAEAVGSDRRAMPALLRGALPKGKTMDICGAGQISITEANVDAAQQKVNARTQEAMKQAVDAMLHSTDLHAKAAGLMAQTFANKFDPAAAPGSARDDLVQMAISSGDPAVYGLAVAACDLKGEFPVVGPCQGLSAKDWVALDPGNAVPLLRLAADAAKGGDGKGEAEALKRAAAASRFDPYTLSLLTFAQPAIPKNLNPLDRYGVASTLTTYAVNSNFAGPYIYFAHSCREPAAQDAGRRRVCGAIADHLVANERTLLGFGIGVSIGASLGWPAPRVAELKLRKKVFDQVLNATNPDGGFEWFTCNAARARTEALETAARIGEMGVARSALEQSGLSESEWAQRYDDHMKELLKDSD